MTFAPAIAVLLGLSSVIGSGKLTTQERPVAPFHALAVSAGIQAQVHRGATTKVTVRGDDNVIDLIETTVKDGRLEVHPKSNTSFSHATMELDLTIAALDGIESSGGAAVKGDGLTGAKCTLKLSGGSAVDLGAMASSSTSMRRAARS